MSDVIDGTAEDLERPPTDADEQHTMMAVAQRPALSVTPQVHASDLVQRLAMIREAQDHAMKRDVDYGVVPGTNKPTLLKPGAEKLSVLFQLDVQLENEKTWGPDEHLTVISRATVFHAPTGARLGYGEGLCTTREKKYAKRKQERVCPTCGAPAVIKGKAEYGGGWLCWKKRDGCGAKFPDGDSAVEGQEVGEIENPDLPDLWNTVLKMAEKRARVDAVLAVTGASALFTQDAEDHGDTARDDAPAPTPTASRVSDVPADTAEPITPELRQKLLAAYRVSETDPVSFVALLDRLGVPRHENLDQRVAWMTVDQALEAIGVMGRKHSETAAA